MNISTQGFKVWFYYCWPILLLFSSKSVRASNFAELSQAEFRDTSSLIAQATSNEDKFIQPTTPETLSPATTPDNTSTPTVPPAETNSDRQYQVNSIEVSNSTIFSQEDLNPIVKPLEGKLVTETELKNVADAITQLYLDRGFITSRALLVTNSLETGNIKIQIVEGAIETIEIEGTESLQDYVRARLELGATRPLNNSQLEDRLRLLKTDPLFKNIEASLRAGTGVGQSILKVIVQEASLFSGDVSIDNYSPPSIGGERLGLDLGYRNLLGLGDGITVSYRPRFDNFDTYNLDFSLTVPINPNNGTLQFRSSLAEFSINQEPFKSLNIRGDSQLYELSYRQPFVRNPREEFAMSLGFTYQTGQTFTFAGPTPFGFGPEEDGSTTTSVLKFGQEYISRSVNGAWAFRSQFNFGLGLFDVTNNAAPIPDAHFFSWLLQAQRVQVIDENNFLILQLDLQLAPNPLLPSQQFVIGGGQSVRGYRQNVLAGDNGLRFSIEDRMTVMRNSSGDSTLQLIPFLDGGTVWNDGDNPNAIGSDDTFIISLGLGLLWQPTKGLNLRFDYAPPLIELDNKGNNIQDDGFHFSATYQF
jgi:hemolysin activation/secretion protein